MADSVAKAAGVPRSRNSSKAQRRQPQVKPQSADCSRRTRRG
eukprot:CAMPEP_0179015488 /NCGR_PEP_ID=MMETSP0796-20121207/2818_1 /TAXON_ID=73915 /ORGANISM="Pyrodinium bahamense, Strain pbaha01" /LENGTH=41 /DNA_ID= /DNA_START= /DNA_END= /DNA_ORIENTATION=